MLETIIFGLFAGLLLSSAIMVVFASQTIHRALWLVLSFISTAALWISLHAEFLGLILVLVYVGAVLTLFLFVIMTFSPPIQITLPNKTLLFRNGLALSIILIGMGCILYALYAHLSTLAVHHLSLIPTSHTHTLGIELYTHYVYPFELIGILLLIAIIVTISLHSHFQASEDKSMNRRFTKKDQLNTKRSDRIKLVSGD